MNDVAHEVTVLCNCGDIERCETERYVSDIRIAFAEIERLQMVLDLQSREAA